MLRVCAVLQVRARVGRLDGMLLRTCAACTSAGVCTQIRDEVTAMKILARALAIATTTIVLGCNRPTNERSEVPKEGAPSLAAVSTPAQPPLARAQKAELIPKPCIDLDSLKKRGFVVNDKPGEITAWCFAFGKRLTDIQKRRAAELYVWFLYSSPVNIGRSIKFNYIDSHGYLTSLNDVTVKFSKAMDHNTSKPTFINLADTDSTSPEVAYAILNYNEADYTEALEGRTAMPPVAAPSDLGDEASSWVSLRSPEAVARYRAWSDIVTDGLPADRQNDVKVSIIKDGMRRIMSFVYYNRGFKLFDDDGHFVDIAAYTALTKQNAFRRYGKRGKEVLQQSANFGSEVGAAVWNFDVDKYAKATGAVVGKGLITGYDINTGSQAASH
jgi:hypothetical protein